MHQANTNTLRQDAIKTEMVNIRPSLEIWESNDHLLVEYHKIRCHLIFNIKLGENFRRKTRYVAGGYTTKTTSALTHSLVVVRDFVHITFLLAVDIKACDKHNIYLIAECKEKYVHHSWP